MNSVDGFPNLVELGNDPRIQAAGPPAMGGVGNARGLAGLYAALLIPLQGALVSTRTSQR